MALSQGAALLKLQEIDLEIARQRSRAEAPEELERLKALLQTSKRVAALVTSLTAKIKDEEMDLAELSSEQTSLREEIDALKERARTEAMDHRQQAWANERHASLAKRLDKADYHGEQVMERIEALEAKRDEANAAARKLDREIAVVKASIRSAVEEARAAIGELEAERADVAGAIDDAYLERYEQASRRFDGLAVEALHGRRPSVCSMALEPRSVEDAWRSAPITTCPYCRRILVVGEEGT